MHAATAYGDARDDAVTVVLADLKAIGRPFALKIDLAVIGAR